MPRIITFTQMKARHAAKEEQARKELTPAQLAFQDACQDYKIAYLAWLDNEAPEFATNLEQAKQKRDDCWNQLKGRTTLPTH